MAKDMSVYLHRWAASDPLDHERIGSIASVGTCHSQGNAYRVEFCIFASGCWTGPSCRRNYRSKITEPNVSWPCRVDCRNSLGVHLHRIPLPCSVISCQISSCIPIAAEICRWIQSLSACLNHWLPCRDQFAFPALEFKDLMKSSYYLDSPRASQLDHPASLTFYLSCSAA